MTLSDEKKKIYLPEPLSFFRETLSDEIYETEKSGQSTTILKNGKNIRSEKDN